MNTRPECIDPGLASVVAVGGAPTAMVLKFSLCSSAHLIWCQQFLFGDLLFFKIALFSADLRQNKADWGMYISC